MSESFRLKLSNQKDLVTIFKNFGRSAKNAFKAKEKARPTESDGFSFGVVYANNLTKIDIREDKPNFPEGSIIIREKRAEADSQTPQVVLAMVKREKGFSRKTDDWEFLKFNGSDLKLQMRETKGDCAKCHFNAKKTDFVFQWYLMKG